ncbi:MULTISPECIES: MFS transporter [unclassified Streptomyces]|uniref:MFS transporter n=1 Tax=unclassified Streptomyces TaxID=2593676 RepID=UPI0008818D90|nr:MULTISPECIES: MFS transporter [unclassified Streptomyces]PBC84058.1 MFS transporter [Streptomyces sp. 2321.6]SDR35521.1 Major Facilitator Superfamily protein [Streptomyces sp. KS_16]SED18431.1 Major Facilitator Superfamily protein [Streptomyces sp. 2133.1]SEE62840.1 Major Facilitator Superfamily protein [Streptomyces sp. 2112.3]SNC70139.1 Major Facilitator Superfamily protein [Streptomyces sp. 2114.4]
MKSRLIEDGPGRTLILGTLVNSLGNGAFLTCSALYFTRIVGFSPSRLGLGLTIAGIAGLFAGVPFGHLADRRGPRGTAAALLALAGLATSAYLTTSAFPVFVVIAFLYALFERGAHAARQALIPAVLNADNLVRVRAKIRVVTNVGVSAGAGLGGLALLWDTGTAYRLTFLLNAVSFLGCGLLFLRLPAVPPAPRRAPGEPRLAVLRDTPYALLAVLNMVMLLHIPILEVILPLWIALHTGAPPALTAVLLLLNTLAVVGLQVPLTKKIEGLRSAVRAFRIAGVALLGCCAAFALSAGRGPVAATAALAVAAALHVYGEMVQSAGSWVIGYELAPADKQGQYQGLFNTGIAAVQMFGPVSLTLLLIDWGTPGWMVLGAVFLAGGLAMAPAVRWAEGRLAGARSAAATAV